MTDPPQQNRKVRLIQAAPPKSISYERGVIRFVDDRKTDMTVGIAPTPGEPKLSIASAHRTTRQRPDDPGISKLAALIAGTEVPDGLLTGLEKAVAALRWTIQAEAKHPYRSALRSRLSKMREAAHDLRCGLTDTTVIRELVAAAGDDLAVDQAAYRGLESLMKRIDVTLSTIKEGKGSHKHDSGANPLETCALCVAFVWHTARGVWPPHTSAAAQAACSCLWLLAGGPARGYGGAQAGRWRERLQRASLELASGARPEFARLFW